MIEYVDAVVVGSGFGASAAAYRLAEAGRSVVVLERGRAYPPGSFARNPYEMSRAFWEPKDELLGLFDVRCRETNISSPMTFRLSLMISIVNGSSAVAVMPHLPAS